ncbi:hypothetical protein BOTNAR_0066g00190 [Botryotinia narcissicola]|uniref:Uncharacterized protein n=1 Tax=Botryotinia narcissicola TaxID=278944 RepID=A0A4Z1IXK2_9HELO|nr:hypothetical protein BOTNAR_0066g00190 [Botryotinia narcissicola]
MPASVNLIILKTAAAEKIVAYGSAATQAIVKPATAAAEMLCLKTSIYKVTSKTTMPAGAPENVKPTM